MKAVVSELRKVNPQRGLSEKEAKQIAELQALQLVTMSDVKGPAIPETVISGIWYVKVKRIMSLPVSGSALWADKRWNIALNGSESLARQRFSLAHEFKHILDHPYREFLYPASSGRSAHDRAEHAADYFAACLLMPRPWVVKLWEEGDKDAKQLARKFQVSQAAMRVRLDELGLTDKNGRCEPEPSMHTRAALLAV